MKGKTKVAGKRFDLVTYLVHGKAFSKQILRVGICKEKMTDKL